MGDVRLTARARRDMLDIWLGVAVDNEAAANRLYDRLEARLNILKTFPEAGSARPEIGDGARVLVEPPYLFLYRILDGGVQIARVLHGARDLLGAEFNDPAT